MAKSLTTGAFLLGCAFAAFAIGHHGTGRAAAQANVYVAQSATGSGAGSSCADAVSAAFFDNESNWGPGKPIAPGTVVALCGTIDTPLTAQGSGRSGKPITILFTPGAKLSEPVCPSSGCLTLSDQSYITVDGGEDGVIENTDNGTSLGHQSTTAGIVAQPCNHCEIEHLTIRNMYVRTGSGDEVDNSGENCIKFNGSDWRIHDNLMHDASWCLYEQGVISGTTGIRIYRNDIYDIDHGYIISGSNGGRIGDVWFDGNHVHDTALWDSVGNSYHHDGIHCYTGGAAGMHIANLYIYDNRFDGAIGNHMTSWVFLEGPEAGTACNDATSRIWIFDNVAAATDNPTDNPVLNTAAGGKILFAYNTIEMPDPSDTGSTCVQVIAGGTYVDNAIGGCNKLVSGAANPARLDYNAYAHCTGSYNCFSIGPTSSWTASFALYRSRFRGLDTHSVFRPAAATGADASGVGESVASLCSGALAALCRDIRGALRPIRMRPDAGAYQAETAEITSRSVGEARIGAPKASIARVYGTKRTVGLKRPILGVLDVRGAVATTYRRHRGTLTVSYVGGRVSAVATTSPYYTTTSGFGVGAAVDEGSLVRHGWRRCGDVFFRPRRSAATAIRVARGHVVALAVATHFKAVCSKNGSHGGA